MRLTSKYFFVGMALVIFLVLVSFTVSFLINSASSGINTFYVSKVSGVPNFSNPGGEAFWSLVPTVTVPLIASSNYPPSGATSTVGVQIAWTNSTPSPELLVKLKFSNYGSSASYASPLKFFVNNTAYPSGQVLPAYQNLSCTSQFSSCYGGFYPQDIGTLPLAIGSNYTYPEQATVLLGMSPGAGSDAWYQVSYKPKMQMGTAGALGTGGGGQAELWTWSSNPTDNASADTGYPGLKLPNGSALSTSAFGLPARASYAIDGYSNVSAYYQIGGLPNSSQFLYINNPSVETNNLSTIGSVSPSSLMNPYEVQAKGVYDASAKSWTVEFVRNLTTSSVNGENNFQEQFNTKNTGDYYIAFEINQGQASETYLIYYGSVSFWWRLNFTNTPPYVGYNNQFGGSGSGQQGISPLSIVLLAAFLLAYSFKGIKEGSNMRSTGLGLIRRHGPF
jgi:hypothetical protein